jgi:hypothetical protein
MDGEEGTTKFAKGTKREAKLLFMGESNRQSTILKQGPTVGLWVNFGHYPELERERFIHQAFSRISRIS